MIRFRETNHLRKLANANGKQMRGRIRGVRVDAWPFCRYTQARLITENRMCCVCGRPLLPREKEA